MFNTLKKFFDFCSKDNRKKFYLSIFLTVISSLFNSLKIPAIGILMQAILGSGITSGSILLSLGLMLVSVLGVSIIKYKATILQTEAGYGTAADKRIEIAQHMRYMPMGYFNDHSLGNIMSVATNTMENLSDVGTRVVMMVTEGIITTAVITLVIFLFDWHIGLVITAGLVLYLLANSLLQQHSKKVATKKVHSDTALVEKVLEYIKGIAEVKAYHLTANTISVWSVPWRKM